MTLRRWIVSRGRRPVFQGASAQRTLAAESGSVGEVFRSLRSKFWGPPEDRPPASPPPLFQREVFRREEVEKFSPEQMINAVPPIVVDGWTAVCDGGSGALGHPVEYIQLNKSRTGEPETCKYCGLRFVSKQAVEHSHH